VYAFLTYYTYNNHKNINAMEELKGLSIEQMKDIDGGKEFEGEWWCVFCWIDHFSE
jgi:hypothetical protein